MSWASSFNWIAAISVLVEFYKSITLVKVVELKKTSLKTKKLSEIKKENDKEDQIYPI